MAKWKVITFWVLSGLLGAAFLMAGGTKLAGDAMHVENFAKWGLPAFMIYVTGLVEVGGAVLLLIPKTRFYGAAVLTGTMVGALLTHVVSGVDLQMLPANLALGGTAALLAWTHRPEWLLGGSQIARARTA